MALAGIGGRGVGGIPRSTAADRLVLAYVGWTALATLASPEPLVSLTGARLFWDGLVAAIAAGGCWRAARALLWKDSRRAVRALTVAAGGTFVALLAALGVAAVLPGIGETFVRDGRWGSLMGQPTFLAGLAVTWIPLLLALSGPALRGLAGASARRAAAVLAVPFGLAAAIALLAGSQSRSGWIAGAMGLALFAVLSAGDGRARVRRALVALPLIATVAVGVVVLRAPDVGSAWDSVLEEGAGRSRLTAWDAALDATADDLLLGNGPGTFAYVWCAGVTPESYLAESDTVLYDAHDWYLNAAATAGLPAGLAAAGIGALAFVLAWRRRDDRIALAAACGAAAYAVHSILTPNGIATFAGALAVLAVAAQPPDPVEARGRGGLGVTVVLAVVALGLVAQGARVTAAETSYAYGWENARIDALERAVRLAPEIPAYHMALAQARADEGDEGARGAFEVLEAGRAVVPRDPVFAAAAGRVVVGAAALDGTSGEIVETALAWVGDAVEACPNDPGMRSTYARTLILAGEHDRAREQVDVLAEQIGQDHPRVRSLRGSLAEADR